MFDEQVLRATPGNARRLAEFARLNGAALPEQVLALATTQTVDVSRLVGTPLELSSDEQKVVQRLADWHGRGLVLSDGLDQARKVALANLKLRAVDPTLIMAPPKAYAEWATIIRTNWPHAKISVFGNPRYHTRRTGYPDGVAFNEQPDVDADFLITSCGSVHWHDLLGKVTPGQSIVEELDNSSEFGWKFMESMKGLFVELRSPVLLQDINRLPKSSTTDILTNMQTQGSQAVHQLGVLLTDYLWAGNDLADALLGNPKNTNMFAKQSSGSVLSYLHRRGYSSVDLWRLLPVLGVSTELVTGAASKPMEFHDLTVHHAMSRQNKKSSGVTRVVQRERELEDHTGQTTEQIVSRAVQGDTTAAALIRGLRTTQWANLKAASVRQIIESVGSKLSRTLVIAEHPDLVRALKLTLTFSADNRYATSEDLASSASREATLARFIFPDSGWIRYQPDGNVDRRPLNTLIIKQSDLDNPDLVRLANFVVLAEWPTDLATYQVIKEDYVEANGARLVHTTLVGTVEEKLHAALTQKS